MPSEKSQKGKRIYRHQKVKIRDTPIKKGSLIRGINIKQTIIIFIFYVIFLQSFILTLLEITKKLYKTNVKRKERIFQKYELHYDKDTKTNYIMFKERTVLYFSKAILAIQAFHYFIPSDDDKNKFTEISQCNNATKVRKYFELYFTFKYYNELCEMVIDLCQECKNKKAQIKTSNKNYKRMIEYIEKPKKQI